MPASKSFTVDDPGNQLQLASFARVEPRSAPSCRRPRERARLQKPGRPMRATSGRSVGVAAGEHVLQPRGRILADQRRRHRPGRSGIENDTCLRAAPASARSAPHRDVDLALRTAGSRSSRATGTNSTVKLPAARVCLRRIGDRLHSVDRVAGRLPDSSVVGERARVGAIAERQLARERSNVPLRPARRRCRRAAGFGDACAAPLAADAARQQCDRDMSADVLPRWPRIRPVRARRVVPAVKRARDEAPDDVTDRPSPACPP